MEWFLANLVVCVAAFVQASLGIGFAMLAVPLLVLINVAYAPAPVLFVMLFLALGMTVTLWESIDWAGFQVLFPGLIIGTVLGGMVIGSLDSTYFGLVFGILLLTALAATQSKTLLPRVDSSAGRLIGGFFSGLMGTITGVHGAALAVVYRSVDHATAVATIAFVFVIASLLSLLSLYWQGLFGLHSVYLGSTLLPGLILGYLIHWQWRKKIPEALLRNGMLVVAALSGLTLIIRSVSWV